MFAFNTIEEESTRQEVVELGLQDVVDLTRFGTLYSFN
jgi:hypothetical protein